MNFVLDVLKYGALCGLGLFVVAVVLFIFARVISMGILVSYYEAKIDYLIKMGKVIFTRPERGERKEEENEEETIN